MRPSQPTCPASPPPSWTSSSVQTAKNTTRSCMKSVASSILLTQSTPSGTRTSATAKLMPSTSEPWKKRKQRGQGHSLLSSQHHTRTTFLILRKAGCDGLLQTSSCFCALADGASGFTLLEVILDDFHLCGAQAHGLMRVWCYLLATCPGHVLDRCTVGRDEVKYTSPQIQFTMSPHLHCSRKSHLD